MLKSLVLGLCVPSFVALVTTASGCTVTNNTDGPDGSTRVTPTGDSGTSPGVLDFHPSNLGDLLSTLDLSKVDDIDVKGAGADPGLECAKQGAGSCVLTTVTQSDGSTAKVFIAKSWKIEPTGDMPIVDNTPVILVGLDTITVLGMITATATGGSGTAGGYSAASGGFTGAGPGAGGASHDMSGAAIGAGGASHCGVGGKGGNGSGSFGLGGPTYGTATVVPLQGGSAGGGGGSSGGGGGALQLVAGTSITIASGAAVSAGGGGGYFGSGPGSGANAGGSGGALLLESPVVSVIGTIAANGGAGSGGGAGKGNSTGADATPNATPAVGGATGTAGAGGNGSGEAAAGSDGAPGDTDYGAGGGGGGAGWIRINTRTGAAAITGTLSPAAATSCATQGTLN